MRTCAFDLAALYADHHRLVRWIVQGVGTPRHAVDDLVQDAFVAAYRRRAAAPEGDAERRRWLVGVTRSVCHHHRRGVARRHQRLAHWVSPAELGTRSLDEMLDDRLALQRVWDVLATLDPAQREAYVLVELHGMSAPEAAALLGTKLNTVYSRVRLARRRLDAELTDPRATIEAARIEGRPAPEQRRRTWLAIAAELALPTVGPATLGPVTAGLTSVGLGSAILGTILGISLLNPASARDLATTTQREPAPPSSTRRDETDAGNVSGSSARSNAPADPSPALPSSVPTDVGAKPTAAAPSATVESTTPLAVTRMRAQATQARGRSTHPTAPLPDTRATPPPKAEAIATTPATTPTHAPTSALSAEAKLLRAATAALDAGDHDRAIALLDRHRIEHPRGLLTDERTRLRARL